MPFFRNNLYFTFKPQQQRRESQKGSIISRNTAYSEPQRLARIAAATAKSCMGASSQFVILRSVQY
jgi:hypothetical protein